STITALH
ncbi:unnamed protein product, partial [Allacma fusca]